MSILTQNTYTHGTFLTLKTEPTEGHLRLCYGKIEEPIPIPWVESGVVWMREYQSFFWCHGWLIYIILSWIEVFLLGFSYQNTEETLLLRIFSANFHRCNNINIKNKIRSPFYSIYTIEQGMKSQFQCQYAHEKCDGLLAFLSIHWTLLCMMSWLATRKVGLQANNVCQQRVNIMSSGWVGPARKSYICSILSSKARKSTFGPH